MGSFDNIPAGANVLLEVSIYWGEPSGDSYASASGGGLDLTASITDPAEGGYDTSGTTLYEDTITYSLSATSPDANDAYALIEIDW